MTNSPNTRHPTHFPRRANMHVADMKFATEVDAMSGKARVDLGILPALDADGIIDGQDIATALTAAKVTTIANHDDNMGAYGRNVTIVLDGAGTPAVTVHGLDYLNQPIQETITAAGTTGVAGKKAFKLVEAITCAATAGRTLDVGYANILGMPYCATILDEEIVDNVKPTAGAFVAAVDTQTATSGDPRGTYAPHSSVIPDGARDITLSVYIKMGDLHGSAHFNG